MKKFFLILISIVLIFSCCSCGEKTAFVEGNLLFDLGAKSFDDIKKVEFLYEEYQGDFEEKLEITQRNDIEILCDYTYYSDYPSDKLHEIFVFPSDSIYVNIGDVQYQLFLGEDGVLIIVPSNNTNKARTYKTEMGKGFTDSVWKLLIKKYQ